MVHLLGRGGLKPKEFGAVVELMGFEHGVESMQEFAHDGDQGLHFEFALGEQMLVEGAQVRVVLDGDQGGHEESMTQVLITCLANTRLLMHGGPRGVLARVESGVGYPLASLQIGCQHAQLPQELHGAGFTDPRHAVEQFKALRQLGILRDQLARLAGQPLDGPFLGPQAARQITPHHRRNRLRQPGRMLTILLRRLHLHQLPQAPRQRVQGQHGHRGPLPGFKGHMQGKLFQYPRVDLIVLAALHHSLSEMTDGAGIGYHHLDALLPAQRQRQVQTVETCRLHANAYHAARLPQVRKDHQMAFRRVGESSQRLQVPLPPQAHHQFLRTDFDSTRLQLAHNTLPELSFGSGPPDPVPSPVELEYAGSYGLGFSSAWEKRAGGLSTRQAREFPPGLSADRPPPPDSTNSTDTVIPQLNLRVDSGRCLALPPSKAAALLFPHARFIALGNRWKNKIQIHGKKKIQARRYPSADGFLRGSSQIRAALRCSLPRTRDEKPHRNPASDGYLCATRSRKIPALARSPMWG